ncbi:MAG: DEDD exonuclease domain-containing protein [Rhodothermales bacterium]
MLVRETPFVVVDTETTGTDAEADRLLEVAAVKVLDGKIIDQFTQLINPQRSVPYRITQLTGITTAMVFDQPVAADVLPGFLHFLGDNVFVAHNLTFDLRFLNAELDRADLPHPANSTLCTLRLARRLLRGLRSKGLSSIADFYGLPIKNRHRALGDAEATAEIFLRFLSQLAYEHEIDTLDELLHFQHRKYSLVSKEPAHLRTIRETVLPRLPDAPGVYFMKDRHDAIIYIGKANSLRARVRSYFTGIEAHPERIRKLVRTARGVEWTETGSELSALLMESHLIKEHKPRFNRAQRRYRNRPFVRLDTSHVAPRISLTTYLQDDGAEYFGPLSGRRQADVVAGVINQMFLLRECDDDTFKQGRRCLYAAIGRCTAPCEGGEVAAAYSHEVQRVRDFLTGQDRSVLEVLEARMREAATAMKYELAGEYRDWLQRLEHLLDKQQRVASPVLDHNAVLVQPGREPGTSQLFLVRFGRHAETCIVAQPPKDDEIAHLRERLAYHFNPDQERPARYLKREVEEVRLLAHWMYVRRNSTQPVRWQPGHDLDAFLEAVLHQVAEPSVQS